MHRQYKLEANVKLYDDKSESTSALTCPIRTSSKSSALFISSRCSSGKYQLYDPRYSYEEQQQQQQQQQEYENVAYNNENNSVEYQTNHRHSAWEDLNNNIIDEKDEKH
jgi:hypothetical protein